MVIFHSYVNVYQRVKKNVENPSSIPWYFDEMLMDVHWLNMNGMFFGTSSHRSPQVPGGIW
jgi:hypothetical protein